MEANGPYNVEQCKIIDSAEIQHDENEVLSNISLVDQLESKLEIGQIVKSVDDAYLLYCSYAHAKGFSVKKGAQRYFAQSSELQSKEFECSCEGKKDEKYSKDKIPSYQKPSTRTDCKARLKISRERDGEWKVSRFDKEHNHEMLDPDQRHLLRSSRSISHAKSLTLEAMVNAGISVSNVVSYMENEAQGPQYLGFTRKDAYNHLDRLRRYTRVENGDATALIRYFISKSNKEFNFYWNVQVDDDDRLMNVFFRDYRCLVDYEHFGDVLSVDTTYKTNRYNLVCMPFVGINHHKQNVMFGLAFMSDETQSSFEWLFNTFLDSMNGKQPQTIFSDQCQAMINAIEKVFPESHHRLCQWHIDQNAPSHLGNLNGDREFKQLWYKCMRKCDSEEEFELTWRIMIDTYNIAEHKWLMNMYKIRHKWSTAFNNNKFSAGLLATSRSESTNAALKKAGTSTITLYDFVLNCEKVLSSWRSAESREDTRCLLGKPSPLLKGNPFLAQVADVYTLNIFKKFEQELVACLNLRFVGDAITLGDNLFEFHVKSIGENSAIKKVVFDRGNHVITCSCHKFETGGILCKHALKVLSFADVNALPERYIIKRWMKNVKHRFNNKVEEVVSKDVDTSDMIFVNQTMRSTYDLCMRCKGNEEAKTILVGCIEDAEHQLDELFENLDINDKCNVLSNSLEDVNSQHIDVAVRNPKCAKTRETTNARIVRHWEKSKTGKGKGKVRCSNAKTSRKKRLCSQGTDHITPPQRATLDSVQFQPFAPYIGINQPWPYYQYFMQDSRNVHFVHPHPSGPSQDPKSSI